MFLHINVYHNIKNRKKFIVKKLTHSKSDKGRKFNNFGYYNIFGTI